MVQANSAMDSASASPAGLAVNGSACVSQPVNNNAAASAAPVTNRTLQE